MSKKSYFILIISYLVIIILLIFFWNSQKKKLKSELLDSINFVYNILPEALIDSAYKQSYYPVISYDSLRNILNKTCNDRDLKYLYSIIPYREDTFLFIISSYTHEDILNDMISKYLMPYYQYPDVLNTLSADNPINYTSYSDEYGSFYSAFHYFQTSKGNPYIIGADYSLDKIISLNWKFIFIILGVTMIFIFIYIYHKNLKYNNGL